MKKLMKALGLFTLLGVLAFPLLTFAGEFKASERVYIGSDQVISNNLYAAGTDVTVLGTIEGDAYIAASNVEVSGEVLGNLFVAAENVKIGGQVHGTVYGASNNIQIDSDIAHNLYAAGQNVTIESTGRIGWDAHIASMKLGLLGRVSRDLWAACEVCDVKGVVGRNAQMEVGPDSLALSDQASIGGDLNYYSHEAFLADDLAQVQGSVIHQQYKERPQKNHVMPFVFSALSLLLVGIVFVSIFKNNTSHLVKSIDTGLWKMLGIGFVGLIVIPFVIIFLFAILIGWPLALFLLAGYLIYIYLSFVVAAIWTGELLVKHVLKLKKYHAFIPLIIGVLIVQILPYIPFIGGLLLFALMLIGFGALIMFKYHIVTKVLPKLKL